MNKRTIQTKLTREGQLTGADRELVLAICDEFCHCAGLLNDRRTQAQLSTYLEKAAAVCKELQISPAFYVRAVLAYQAPDGKNDTYMPWQVAPMHAFKYVDDYLKTTGKRDVKQEFETQCRMLGTALSNGIPDDVCLLNPSADFAAWFRILMTAQPNQRIINIYGKEAAARLNKDPEMRNFLSGLDTATVKLDLGRIPQIHT